MLFILLIVPVFISQSLASKYGIQSVLMIVYFSSFSLLLLTLFYSFKLRKKHFFIIAAMFSMLVVLFCIDFSDGFISYKGYKVILLLFSLLILHNLSNYFSTERLCASIFFIFLIYIVVSFLSHLLGNTNIVNVGSLYIRYDLTGSVTAHAVLCSLYIMFSSAYYLKFKSNVKRLALVASSFVSLYMIFLTGNRQSLIILILFGFILAYQQTKQINKSLFYFSIFITLFMIFFILFTLYVDSNMYYRVFNLNSDDVMSGRGVSVLFWLDKSSTIFGGLGLGYIAQYGELYGGILETYENFPHNEYIRFYIEGGILGLVFIVTLLFVFFKLCFEIIKNDENNLRAIYVSAFFSVVFIMSIFDNLFFDMYKSNFYYLSVILFWSLYRKELVQSGISKT